MPFEDLKVGHNKKREPKNLTLDRQDGPKEIPDILFHYSGEKRVKVERAKQILENYLIKVPAATWSELKDHFDKILQDFSENDKALFKKYFEELKKAQVVREKIVEKSNPAFNKVALYMHAKLKENNALSYEDIITTFFEEHLDDPLLDGVDDEVLKKLEDVFPKIQEKYKNN